MRCRGSDLRHGPRHALGRARCAISQWLDGRAWFWREVGHDAADGGASYGPAWVGREPRPVRPLHCQWRSGLVGVLLRSEALGRALAARRNREAELADGGGRPAID